jgi:hypothetical protein
MKLLPTALVLSLAALAASPASAGHCDSTKDLAAKVEKTLGAICGIAGAKIDCSKVAKAKDKLAEAVAKWNTVFKDSPGQIGPRTIEVGGPEGGELIAGGVRTFLTPLALSGKFEVEVTKKDGKAADIHLCAVDGTGKAVHLESMSFDAGDKGSKAKTVALDGVVLIVKLDADKLNKFGYSVKITEK